MRQLRFLFFLAAVVILCRTNKNNNPVSFVDGYTPTLLDPKGTVYQGTYFPLRAGMAWTDISRSGWAAGTHLSQKFVAIK